MMDTGAPATAASVGSPAPVPLHRGPAADARALARTLRDRIRGEVRFDDGSRALYATDASNFRQIPIGVVTPRDVEDVLRTVAVCREFDAPIVARGGGTSLAGQSCNVAVVIDMSKHVNRVLAIDPEARTATVEPGVVLDTLRDACAPYGLTFGPDPATHNRCTIGGMIGNNSCGVHSVMAAMAGTGPRTSDNLSSLDVVTYDGTRLRVAATSPSDVEREVRGGGRRGEILRGLRDLRDRHAETIRGSFPEIPRRVSGYDLPALLPEQGFDIARALVGTESTCVLVLGATLRLVEHLPRRVLVVLGYPDVFRAADDVADLLEYRPVGLEGMDDRLVEDMRQLGLHPDSIEQLPDGRGWLLVEFGADSDAEAQQQAERLVSDLRGRTDAPAARLFGHDEAHAIWEVRESGLAATAHVTDENTTWPGWEDSAVPPATLGDYLRDLRRLLDEHGYSGSLYGHFGQGCVHTRIDFDFSTAEGVRKYRRFLERAADLVSTYGGACSGEHGDGQQRGELLGYIYPQEVMEAFRDFKRIWDPGNRMNPGKVVYPRPLDADLRIAGYAPREPETHFRFRGDEGRFSRAAMRCVGVGECRKESAGTMCPSYMVTREEMHSTRGRAHLLFEMLRGDAIGGSWRDDHVHESLDLCLSCKGCKGECPVQVDVATYKAEFMSHYYEGRLRPREAYAFGLVHVWARLASLAPGLANLATQTPGLGTVAKLAAGIPLERDIPAFASQPFVSWFRQRPERPPAGRPRVMLWPDTFNNYFHPQTAAAAVDVLEDAGYHVDIPRVPLCCGRPLYEYGMLDRAKALLRQTLAALEPDLRAGIPIIGLEPSCVSVFRDELMNLYPDDPLARRLKEQVSLFTEFLDRNPGTLTWPTFRRHAVLHEHCHQKAVLGTDGDPAVLRRMGMTVDRLDAGCCGLAGAFGFERRRYDVSMAVGERVLLPAIRAASKEAFVVSAGFSCREQIAHGTDRRALHPAEVMRLATRTRQHGPPGDYPERAVAPDPARVPAWPVALAAFALGALAFRRWGRRSPARPGSRSIDR